MRQQFELTPVIPAPGSPTSLTGADKVAPVSRLRSKMTGDQKLSSSPSKERSEYSELVKKILTALFYGASSFMIMVVNKTVLTHYHFPSFQVLGIGQMIATVIILNIGRALGIINFPELSTDTFRKIWPLPLMYLGNMVFGLGGTQNLSLPMMTVLRRFSILMTMIGKTTNQKA